MNRISFFVLFLSLLTTCLQAYSQNSDMIWTIINPLEDGTFFALTEEGNRVPQYDLSQQEVSVELNKEVYYHGEKIFTEHYLKNNLETAVFSSNLKLWTEIWRHDLRLIVTDENGATIPRTRLGEQFYPMRPGGWLDAAYTGGMSKEYPAGETTRLFCDRYSLGSHRDLSCPGTYTFQVAAAENAQESNRHLVTKPVSFRVAPGPAFASSGLKKPGKWDHPAENPLEFAPVTNSPKTFSDLPPEGDYSKLKLVLRSNKAKHGADEPVFVRIFLKNESETWMPVCLEPSGFWGDARFSVTDSQGNPVPKTRLGKRRFPIENRPENGIDWIFSGPGFAPSFVKIPPGREIEIGPGEILLNLYYDISVPGKYRLRIARSTLLPGQAYENPLESNELSLDTRGSALRPEDLLDPGNFETQSLP